jgi:phage gp36-like protein
MPYATPEDVRAQLAPDPTQPAGTAGELSDATLEDRIASASAQVDAALNARYAVPFTVVPRLVADITTAIASYLAELTYRKSVDVIPTDPLYLRYQWASVLLGQLSSGKADLPIDGPTPAPRERGSAPIQPYSGEMFPAESFGLGYSYGRYYARDNWWR